MIPFIDQNTLCHQNLEGNYDSNVYDQDFKLSGFAAQAVIDNVRFRGVNIAQDEFNMGVGVWLDFFGYAIHSLQVDLYDLSKRVSTNAQALIDVAYNSESEVLEQLKQELNTKIDIANSTVRATAAEAETRYIAMMQELKEEKATLQNQFVELCRALAVDDLEEARKQARKHLLTAWIDHEIADQERIEQGT